LQSLANGFYLTADTNGVLPVAANATAIDRPQIFEWVDNGDGSIYLRALANSLLVSATNKPTSYPLIASRLRSSAGNPETFLPTAVGTNALVFVAPPNDGIVASNMTAGALGEIQVQALSAGNIPAAGIPIFLEWAAGAGPLPGNTAMTDSNGVAHFASLQTQLAGAKVLRAFTAAFAPAVSQTFYLRAATNASLVIESLPDGNGQPVGAQALSAGSNLTVYAVSRDIFGNFVTNMAATWSLVNLTGGVGPGDLGAGIDNRSATLSGHLVGSTQIRAVAGFTNTSGVITVLAGAPTILTVQQQPAVLAKVAQVFSRQPVVWESDGYGNPGNLPVTVYEAGGLGNVNRNASGVSAIPFNGVASFAGLYLTNAGFNALVFQAGNVSVLSSNIQVDAGNVERLAWSVALTTATNGLPLSQPPIVQTVDAGGNFTTQGLPPYKMVSVSMYSSTNTLAGVVTANIGTVGGVGILVFSNLYLNGSGICQLVAKDMGNGFNPTNIGAAGTCQLWLDAADAGPYASAQSGTNLVQWRDKSSQAQSVTGSATLNLSTNLNAYSPGQAMAMHFNGSQQLNVNFGALTNSSYTMMVLEIGAAKTSGVNYFLGNSGGFNTDLTLGVGYQSPGQFRWQQYADDLNYNAAFTNGIPRLWTLNLGGTAAKNLYLNGSLVGSAVGGFLKGTNLVNGWVGGNGYVGDLAEVVVFTASLSVNDQTNLQNYLLNKWVSGLAPGVSPALNVVPRVYSPRLNLPVTVPANGSGRDLILTGVGGLPGGTYWFLTSTNPAQPIGSWLPIFTNQFDEIGAFSNRLPVLSAEPQRFYRLLQP
ncbi:MAG TPA: hypothetical protein VF607_11405, partial [Verrucomicrobiae bacterium]